MAYGEVSGVRLGDVCPNRRSLYEAGVHRDIQRGIIGRREKLGAESIVLSHGYEDDVDLGDLVFYTGDGGRSHISGKQAADQCLTGRNLTLAKNVESGQPVRVIRRVPEGYRYDGLYCVEEAWLSPGKSGFLVCRFRLRRLGTPPPVATHRKSPSRKESTLYRLVRDSEITLRVKAIHDFRCQACGTRLETLAGPYAEAAHILPLGQGYDGPDIIENVLCLCPNDHVRLDHGDLFILDGLKLVDREGRETGRLKTDPQHQLDLQYIRAHRAIFGRS